MSLSTIVFILNVVALFTFGCAMSELSDNKTKPASIFMIASYACLIVIIDIILFKLNLM